MADISEEEAREVLEEAEKLAEDHDISSIKEAREVVESGPTYKLTEDQKDALVSVLAGGAVVTGSAFGPAGMVATTAAAAYIAKNADTVVGAYRDLPEQAQTVYEELKERF